MEKTQRQAKLVAAFFLSLMPKKNKPKNKGRRKSNAAKPKKNFSFSLKDKHPIFKFLLGFIGCMAVFYLFYHSSFYKNILEEPFLNTQASLSNALLQLFGHETTASNATISSNQFSVNIKEGCDGLEAIAILVSGIMIFPAAWRLKLSGLFAGIFILLVLNILRIAGLYVIGLNFSEAVFEIFHVQGGFILFTMVSVLLWFIWMNWAVKKTHSKTKTTKP